MDKKKGITLGLVGVGSALGLGWLLSKVIKPDEPAEGTPKVEVSISWD